MKKALSLLLAFIAACNLVACGGATSSSGENAPVTSTSIASSSQSAESETQNIEVEEELFDVVVTLPADLVGETTQENLDAAQNNHFHKATLNSDGSVTIEMSKKQHNALLSTLSESTTEQLNKMVGSEEYPDITAIDVNSDFTKFTVTTKNAEISLPESFSVMAFYIFGGMYNAFSGNSDAEITVEFVNADSGKVISTANSSDIAK